MTRGAQRTILGLAALAVAGCTAEIGGPSGLGGGDDGLTGTGSIAGVHWYGGDRGLIGTTFAHGQRGWNVEAVYGVEDTGSRDHALAMARRAQAVDHLGLAGLPTDAGQRTAAPPHSASVRTFA